MSSLRRWSQVVVRATRSRTSVARRGGSSAWVALGLLAGCGGSSPPPSTSVTVPDFGLEQVAGALGSGCATDDDCGTGFCDRTIPGGVCSAPCDAAGDCPAGGVCFEDYCYAACASGSQCRAEGFGCFEHPAGGSGFCAPDVGAFTPAGPNVGAPCSALLQCAAPGDLEPYCIPEVGYRGENTGFAEGMCVAVGCSEDAECGPGAVCAPSGPQTLCLPGCASAADCRTGYVCDPARGACTPAAR